jgi:putative copper export protein/mono/diheme cytochrome c family protein
MVPVFDLQGGAALATVRDAAVMGLLSAFGTIAFRVLVAPKAFLMMPADTVAAAKRQLTLLTQASNVVALTGLGFWLVVQAAGMADANSAMAAFSAVPPVLAKTSFGHVLLLQLSVVLVLAAVTRLRDTHYQQRACLLLSVIAVGLQSGHSHAFSMQPGFSLLLGCDLLHLAGAGLWLGGLVPLLLLVRVAPPKAGATAARWFSPLGQASIAAVVVSASIQGWVLVGSIPGLIGTAYGWLVLIKLALFGVLLALAWCNRYRFAPALLRADPVRAKCTLIRSIALQTGFAAAIVLAAVILSELPPAMHLQALWPFSQRFSLAAVEEDADFRREVLQAGLALGAAIALLVLSLLLRRLRALAAALVAIVAWCAIPHFDLLLATAYPTSFYRSPTGFSAASIVEGAAVFARNCVACHGPDGAGRGVLAKTLQVPPADLTAAHLWMHSDGELFWWISHGMFTPEGQKVMPGFATGLDEEQRWALIDYIRAHNAGHAKQDGQDWLHPVHAASFGFTCGGPARQLSDLRGRFVRLVFGAVPSMRAAIPGLETILVAPPKGDDLDGACTARDETVPPAYAILLGVAPDAMSGMQILVDDDGWLRAAVPAQAAPAWDDANALTAEIMRLRAHKIVATKAAREPMKMPM